MASEDSDKGGRPSKYQPWTADQAAKLCRLGATDTDLADFFGVTERTINRWKLKHPEFCQALKRSKDELDAQVEQALHRRARGYSYTSEKVFQYQGAIVRAKTVVHVPADTVAGIFWLKNRQPDNWRNNPEEGGGGDGEVPGSGLKDPNPDV